MDCVVDLLPGDGVLFERLAATLLPMCCVFPDADVTVIELLPGTVFAAVGLALGESAFSLYVAWSSSQPTASVVAALVAFLTWLYVSGPILLVGTAINAALSNRSENVSLEPVFSGVSPASGSSRTDSREPPLSRRHSTWLTRRTQYVWTTARTLAWNDTTEWFSHTRCGGRANPSG